MKRNHSNKKVRIERSYRPKKNSLKVAGAEKADYKDINLLHQFILDRGKIHSRRITGLTPQRQRQVATAVKSAREATLLPLTSR